MEGMKGDPAYVKQQFNSSLKRLGVDYIDLYYIHRYVVFLFLIVNIAQPSQGLIRKLPLKSVRPFVWPKPFAYSNIADCSRNGRACQVSLFFRSWCSGSEHISQRRQSEISWNLRVYRISPAPCTCGASHQRHSNRIFAFRS